MPQILLSRSNRRPSGQTARLARFLGGLTSLCLVGTAFGCAASSAEPRGAASAVSASPAPGAGADASDASGSSGPGSAATRSSQAGGAPDAAGLEPIVQAVAASDRSADDRVLDPGRHPVETLRFFGVEPGMKLLELAAGGGYTAELLARVVGPSGRVYGQNTPFVLERFAQVPWTERLRKPVMAPVVRIDSELEAPVPRDVSDLDGALMILFYHDTVWFKTDRSAMNRAIFAALKPGGFFGVIDHSARAGAGVSVAETLHRIEEQVVIEEIEAAGFVLEAQADFLKNPDDSRDWNASPSKAGASRGKSDRFVLLFRKPLEGRVAETTGDQVGGDQTTGDQVSGAGATASSKVECPARRSKMCMREYRPVCASVDTRVRCVRAPCPSTEQRTFPNGCTACADESVLRYVSGPCASSTGGSPDIDKSSRPER